jgi:hypothetical protein
MSEEVIDALLVKLGVTVDQASFTESTNAVTGLDNAINRAARDRGKTGIDQVGKNIAATGASAKGLEQVVDKFDKTVTRVPRSVGVLQGRLGSATQQMASFRKETQSVVALLSRGAAATGLGPLSGSMFSMLAGGGPLALMAAGVGGLAANSFSYANGALSTEVSSSTFGVSKSDFQNFNRFGKKVTGEDDVGTQILQAAQKLKMASAVGQVPVDIARYGASPADFADAYKRPTMEVVDLIQKQIRNARDPISRQNIGSALGLSQSGIMAVGEDYRAGIQQVNKAGSTYTDQDVENARRFEDSLVDLAADFDRLRNKLGAEFLPSLDNFVQRVDGMFAQGGIADRITQFAERVSKGDLKGATEVLKDEKVKNAVSTFVHDRMPLVDIAKGTYQGASEGWDKNGPVGAYTGAIKGYFGAMGNQAPMVRDLLEHGYDSAKQAMYAKMPSAHIDDDVTKPLRPEYAPGADGGRRPAGILMPEDQAAAQRRIMKYFMDNNYSTEQASGIAANLTAESGLRVDAVGDNGQAYGLAQWHPERQQDFKDFFGKDIRGSSEKEQLDFILYELQNKEKAAGKALLKTKNAASAASVFRNMYERPADNKEDEARRILYAYQAQNSISTGANAKAASLPSDVPSTYNMVANPPAPPTVNAGGAPDASQAGNMIHIDARGSTDPHRVTSEAVRAVNEQLQGQMTVTMSHMSTDLDQ